MNNKGKPMNPNDLYDYLFYDQTDPVEWAAHNRKIKNLDKEMVYISFENHPFLIEILRNSVKPHSEMVIMKGRQLGLSENFLTAEHFLAATSPNTNIMHTLNDGTQLKDFSYTKLNPIYQETPELRAMITAVEGTKKKADNLHMKQFINNSFLMLTYLKVDKTAKSQSFRGVQIDALNIDEFEDAPDDLIIPLKKGLSASKLKIVNYLGTPKMQQSKFHKKYLQSDQRNWHVKCTNCGTEQILIDFFDYTTWDSHIFQHPDTNAYYFGCEKCKTELDRAAGYWKPTNPSGTLTGYYAPQLIAPWISATDFVREFNALTGRQLTEFIRETLGIPHSGEDAPVRLTWLNDCLNDTYSYGHTHEDMMLYGHDWGNKSYYIVGQENEGKIYISDIGILDDADVNDQTLKLKKRFENWGAFMAVLDSGYGKAQNQKLMPLFPGRVWSCFYGGVDQKRMISWDTAKGKGSHTRNKHVNINHMALVEEVAGLIRDGVFQFPGKTEADIQRSKDAFDIMIQVEKVVEETDSKTKVHYKTTNAHYFMALLYLYLASLRGGSSDSSGATKPMTQSIKEITGFEDNTGVRKPSQWNNIPGMGKDSMWDDEIF